MEAARETSAAEPPERSPAHCATGSTTHSPAGSATHSASTCMAASLGKYGKSTNQEDWYESTHWAPLSTEELSANCWRAQARKYEGRFYNRRQVTNLPYN